MIFSYSTHIVAQLHGTSPMKFRRMFIYVIKSIAVIDLCLLYQEKINRNLNIGPIVEGCSHEQIRRSMQIIYYFIFTIFLHRLIHIETSSMNFIFHVRKLSNKNRNFRYIRQSIKHGSRSRCMMNILFHTSI